MFLYVVFEYVLLVLLLIVIVYVMSGEFVVLCVDEMFDVLVCIVVLLLGFVGLFDFVLFDYECVLLVIKYVGEVVKMYFLCCVVLLDFDDVVFIDCYGCISEGLIWNLVFWIGDVVVWLVVGMFGGVMMGILWW